MMRDRRSPRICVFCSSHLGPENFRSAARQLGDEIASRGWALIYGGGSRGLMGLVAGHAAGSVGGVFGVNLRAIATGDIEPAATSTEYTPTLSARKDRLMSLGDAFVVLPGGIGALDEFCTVISMRQLKHHAKPTVLINLCEYWTPVIGFVAQAERLFGYTDIGGLFEVRPDVESAMEYLDGVLGRR